MNPDDLPAAVRLDRSRHAAPQVFEHLRDAITSLTLAPGTVLSRIELAERFGVSQTPVREALIRLGTEGLVDIFPQHATVVSKIDLMAAHQQHFLRRSLELEIVHGLAQQPDATLIETLRRLITRQKSLLAAREYTEFSAADQQFHRTMYSAAQVPDLWALVRGHSGHIDRLRRLHLPVNNKGNAVVRDHAALVDAIEAGDPAEAQACLRRHLSGTLREIDVIRARFPEFVAG